MEAITHIVHILGTLDGGGAQHVVLDLASEPELQKYKHSIICIIANEGVLSAAFAERAISTYECRLRWSPGNLFPSYRFNRWLRNRLIFTFPWRLSSLLISLKADLVHSHITNPEIHLQANAVVHKSRLPWVWTLHGIERSSGEVATRLAALNSINRTPGAAITAVSQAALRAGLSGISMSQGKAHIIHNGIKVGNFQSPLRRDQNLREEWGISSQALVFGIAGRLVPIKRMDLFIEAARCLLQKYDSIHFVIAGDGSLKEKLKEYIEQNGLQDHVNLVGYQNDIQAFLSCLDVFVLSSDSEGFGNALLEACAMGLPCIATAVGGIPEIIGDNAGILVPPGSADLLAQAMELMLSPQNRETYAKRARQAAEKFSTSRMCHEYASLYGELLRPTCPAAHNQ